MFLPAVPSVKADRHTSVVNSRLHTVPIAVTRKEIA